MRWLEAIFHAPDCLITRHAGRAAGTHEVDRPVIVFGSMRVGERLAIRWKRTPADRIQIVERVYDGEIDDVKTEAGEREVPFDKKTKIRRLNGCPLGCPTQFPTLSPAANLLI